MSNRSTVTRELRCFGVGPTAFELRDFLADVPDHADVRVQVTPGDRPFDVGATTFSVTYDEPTTPRAESAQPEESA